MNESNKGNKVNVSKEELVDLLEAISLQIHESAVYCRHSNQINFPRGNKTLNDVIVKLSQSYGLLCSLIDDVKSIKELRNKKPVKNDAILYCCSTELIHRIREEMIMRRRDRLEDLCFVAGIRIPGTNIIVPTIVLKPSMEHRRVSSARADPLSVYRNLKYIAHFTHTIGLLCHCHPGKGPGVIRESATDKETYSGWEKDYPLIGIIFDEVGEYFRFFSVTKKNFEIEMIGSGVEHVRGNTYCFSE